MPLIKVTPGENLPSEFNVVIEIPSHSDPIKYEVDKDTGALFVDRFMLTSMHYPCNYGYIPQTLSEDGDPTDVLVLTPFPVAMGAVVPCRPVGILKMEDEEGKDAKVLAVPINSVLPIYKHWLEISDIATERLTQIKHFFEHYKDIEDGKWVKVVGWYGSDSAKEEILNSHKRYKDLCK